MAPLLRPKPSSRHEPLPNEGRKIRYLAWLHPNTGRWCARTPRDGAQIVGDETETSGDLLGC